MILLVVLAIFFAASDPCDWAQCGSCGIWHNMRNGRTSFDIPTGWDGVRNDRLCPDCLTHPLSIGQFNGGNRKSAGPILGEPHTISIAINKGSNALPPPLSTPSAMNRLPLNNGRPINRAGAEISNH